MANIRVELTQQEIIALLLLAHELYTRDKPPLDEKGPTTSAVRKAVQFEKRIRNGNPETDKVMLEVLE